MATVSSSTVIATSGQVVWRFYFDQDGWAQWADQFSAVVSSRGYPEAGGELVWRSGAAGRGEVREQVVEHLPERSHVVEFSDPSTQGRLQATFEEVDGGTRVTLEQRYELRAGGLFARLSDVLFVRAQMRASLARSLAGLRIELEAR